MKAVRFHEFGDASVLRYEDVDRPVPGAGEVLIRVAATSFNGVDAGIRGGYLKGPFPVTLPHTPGIDVAGTVEVPGAGAEGFSAGDRVIGFLPMTGTGAAAEYVVAPADVLVAAPASIPLADAAALPLVGLTAWQALFDHAGVRAGQRVLVNGAGGAVGGYAVQLARGAGAHVIATASPRSADRVRATGADEVIDHTATDLAAALTEPVDAVINLAQVSLEDLTALVERIRDGGVLVSSTPQVTAPGDEARGVRGVNLFVHSDTDQLARMVAMVDAGTLRVDVAERVALADLADLHARADAGEVSGKVIVVTGTD
jgi:NADPH:quinone reductase-like Zn-dependent oxidoreductase